MLKFLPLGVPSLLYFLEQCNLFSTRSRCSLQSLLRYAPQRISSTIAHAKKTKRPEALAERAKQRRHLTRAKRTGEAY